MKKLLLTFLFIAFCRLLITAQITTPVIKANFGVDADVGTNYFNNLVQSGNDDWFNNGIAGTGLFVIDTTGAAGILADYLTDASPWPRRMASFYRGMSLPKFSNVNHQIWLDAVYVRDYHDNDSTVYGTGSSKNGMSPANWDSPVFKSIPDKDDILDIFMHVRRDGDGSIPGVTDSLWMFGGLSLNNVTGDRYFDFEMYQTDISYDKASQNWDGYGPDAGHTSWEFDAGGNIIKSGDIILSGEFQSSALTTIEARIWVKKTDWLTVVPTAFNWSGQFDGDGAGAVFGYASISPNTSGIFYTGMGSNNNTWAGPFGLVLKDNSLAYSNPGPASTTNSEYIQDQFIEFSVNLTKLGLDPSNTALCGIPFNRFVVKTRSSASFTAELKDFVAPTPLFSAAKVAVETSIPILCDTIMVSNIYVNNPIPNSTYVWSTPNGHIIGSNTGTSINVDMGGLYIVTQYLLAGCTAFATDTFTIKKFITCHVLDNNLIDFRGSLNNNVVKLNWTVQENQFFNYFDVERSTDGINFTFLHRVEVQSSQSHVVQYDYRDDMKDLATRNVYYRISTKEVSNKNKYSNTIRIPLSFTSKNNVTIQPNPVKDVMQLHVYSVTDSRADINIYDITGKIACKVHTSVQKGNNVISLNNLADKPRGVYQTVIYIGTELFSQKILLIR